jgi:hypothetical protein
LFAKRVAQPIVSPIVTPHTIYSAVSTGVEKGQEIRGGFIEARHSKHRKLLWKTKIYQTDYDLKLERDVQDIFIKTLTHEKSHNLLVMSDEKGRVFVLDLKSQKFTQIL